MVDEGDHSSNSPQSSTCTLIKPYKKLRGGKKDDLCGLDTSNSGDETGDDEDDEVMKKRRENTMGSDPYTMTSSDKAHMREVWNGS